MTTSRTEPDELTQASVTVAWVIIANKPFYPLYIWWLVGSGVAVSLWSLVAVPFFLLVPWLARRRPLAARVMLPVVGVVDTLFETGLFGESSGTLLFLAPCVMLAALSFHRSEAWWQRGVAALVFGAFVVAYGRMRVGVYEWSAGEIETLFSLNAFAVASLMGFVAVRYAGVERR